MFSKTENKVNFFIDEKAVQKEKVFYGKISVPIKTGEKDVKGRDKYTYETWLARFTGKALEKAKTLSNKTRITLKVWNARNPYSEEQEKSFPYIMVTDFDLTEK